MPPILRPRSLANQDVPLVPREGRKSSHQEALGHIEPAPQKSRKAERAPSKKQVQPSKAKEIQGLKPTAPSKKGNRPQRPRVPKALKAQQQEKEQRRTPGGKGAPESDEPEPASFDEQGNAGPIQSAQITSWAGQVHETSVPDASGVLASNRPSVSNNYASTAPWFRSYGYASSEEDMALTTVMTSEAPSQKKERTRTFDLGSKKFLAGLRARNVELKEVTDRSRKWIENVILPEMDEGFDKEDEYHWEVDMSKCKLSDEAIFQRTIMMDLISRYQHADTLDYTCESQWDCFRMPQRGGELAKRMPMPKPDLAVAFKASAILSTFQQADLGDYINIMCPEVFKEDKCDRAFHFLSIEAKGASGEIANWKAHRQNFNTATQALHNIYFFMKMAGEKELEVFYKTVRFYSVVATSTTFYVRVHRAVEVEEGRIEDDYPLGFLYEVVYNHKGEGYTKAVATQIIKNILVKYGVTVLQPLLQRTMAKVWKQLRARPIQSSLQNGSELQQEARVEAEEHRDRQRAESRQGRDIPAPGSRTSRKTSLTQKPDASFTRESLGNLNMDGTSSSIPDEDSTFE